MPLQTVFSIVGADLGENNISAHYFPYSELKHTWTRGRDDIRFKISDYVKGSPEEVIASLAWYLLSKATGRKVADGRAETYLSYARSRELWDRNRSLYLSRAKYLDLDSQGRTRNLQIVFDYVNSFYFAGRFKEPLLGWTGESPRTRLGYYFPPLNLLVVNKAFDSERVPRLALEFVVYHELLHHVCEPSQQSVRQIHHTSEFRNRERKFRHYEEAEQWLKRLASRKSA